MKSLYLLLCLPMLLSATPISASTLYADNLEFPTIDPTEVCPLIELIDQKLCQNSSKLGFDPTDICPLLELFSNKYCQSKTQKLNPADLCPLFEIVGEVLCDKKKNGYGFDPTKLCPLIKLFEDKYCQ